MFNEIKIQLNPKNILSQFTFSLITYSLIGIIYLYVENKPQEILSLKEPFTRAVISFFIIIGIFKLFYTLNYYFFKIKNINFLNLIITASIIFLVLDYKNTFWQIGLVCILTILIKVILRDKGKPLFNPAVLGLFLTFYLNQLLVNLEIADSRLLISWWGTAYWFKEFGELFISPFTLIYSLIFAYFAWKYKKLHLSLAFLISFFIFTFIDYSLNFSLADLSIMTDFSRLNLYDAINLSLIGSWLFLAFVMLIEPKTSPIFGKQQIFYGIFAALIFTVLNSEITNIQPLWTILILNALLFLQMKFGLFKKLNK